jgi:ABC-2 type transport system ATP-binding protein
VTAIETKGLTKHYGRRMVGRVRALEDVSIEVREGEIFGFLGPNGAGKSTMIRCLLGFLHPTSGGGQVLDHDIARDSLEIRRRVGYLPGGIALYDSMTGQELLEYLGRLYGRESSRRRELCDRLEMGTNALRRPIRDYSRGMRQKMGIIQALQHDPELAILDEPSEGLDPLMQQAFYSVLDDLKKEGRTIFFSSHILPEVERVCDRVAIIREGRLVALEEIHALITRRRRHVELRYAGRPPLLDGVAGVSDIRLTDGILTCLLQGDVGPFLQALGPATITDLTIRPASLEDAFLEYYGPDGVHGGVEPPPPSRDSATPPGLAGAPALQSAPPAESASPAESAPPAEVTAARSGPDERP